jgi:hypothetical protein
LTNTAEELVTLGFSKKTVETLALFLNELGTAAGNSCLVRYYLIRSILSISYASLGS